VQKGLKFYACLNFDFFGENLFLFVKLNKRMLSIICIDQSFRMGDNVIVAVRVRPFADREKERNAQLIINMDGKSTEIK
jgi:hypothetical protein